MATTERIVQDAATLENTIREARDAAYARMKAKIAARDLARAEEAAKAKPRETSSGATGSIENSTEANLCYPSATLEANAAVRNLGRSEEAAKRDERETSAKATSTIESPAKPHGPSKGRLKRSSKGDSAPLRISRPQYEHSKSQTPQKNPKDKPMSTSEDVIMADAEDLIDSFDDEPTPRTSSTSSALSRANSSRPQPSANRALGEASSSRDIPSAFTDDRRTSNPPKRPRQDSPEVQSIGHLARQAPPEWYQKFSKATRRGGNESSSTDEMLQSLKSAILKCRSNRFERTATFDAIRTKLHNLAFETVTAQMLRNHTMLHAESGLPQIFQPNQADGEPKWPFDIVADAKELYVRWCKKDFETDMYRGISRTKPNGRGGEEASGGKIKDGYGRMYADYQGNGDLQNGQWWPLQLAAVRDGAHGHPVGGIYGREGIGALSCIMSGGAYDNEDHGDWVLYWGTDGNEDGPTDGTKLMLESEANKTVIRFLHSEKCRSQFAPEHGVRYDGLYTVEDHELMDEDKNTYRFKLVRQGGQDPLRGTLPQKRPTRREIDEYVRDKNRRKGN